MSRRGQVFAFSLSALSILLLFVSLLLKQPIDAFAPVIIAIASLVAAFAAFAGGPKVGK